MNLLGDCRNESLVDLLFGSVSELARLIEVHGDVLLWSDTMPKRIFIPFLVGEWYNA